MHHKYKVAMKQIGSLCLLLSAAVSLISCSSGSDGDGDGDAAAAYAYSVDNYTSLVRFNRTNVYDESVSTPITGLAAGEKILAIKFHPTLNTLIGLSSASKVYTIDLQTGAATLVVLLNKGGAGSTTPYFTAFEMQPTIPYYTQPNPTPPTPNTVSGPTTVGTLTTTSTTVSTIFHGAVAGVTTRPVDTTNAYDIDIDPVNIKNLRIGRRNFHQYTIIPVTTAVTTDSATGVTTTRVTNGTASTGITTVLTAPVYNASLDTGAVVQGAQIAATTSTPACLLGSEALTEAGFSDPAKFNPFVHYVLPPAPSLITVRPSLCTARTPGGDPMGLDAIAFTSSAPGACRAQSRLHAINLVGVTSLVQLDISTGNEAGNGTSTNVFNPLLSFANVLTGGGGLDYVSDTNGVDIGYLLARSNTGNLVSQDTWALIKINPNNGIADFQRNVPSTYHGLAIPSEAGAKAASC